MFSIKFKSSASQNNFSQSILILEKVYTQFYIFKSRLPKEAGEINPTNYHKNGCSFTNESNLLEI